MTHDEFQGQIIDLAGSLGWEHMHTRRARGRYGWTTPTSLIGWPDLTLWHESRGGHAAIEVKVRPDLPTQEQLDVLASLARAGDLVAVVYPEQFDALVAMLQHRTPFPAYEGRVRTHASGNSRR